MRHFRAFACCSTVDLPAPTFLRTLIVVRSIPIPDSNHYATFRGHFDASLYFNSQQSVCIQIKAVGKQRDADKVSSTYNSLANGTCGEMTDTRCNSRSWSTSSCLYVSSEAWSGRSSRCTSSIRRTVTLSPRYAAPSAYYQYLEVSDTHAIPLVEPVPSGYRAGARGGAALAYALLPSRWQPVRKYALWPRWRHPIRGLMLHLTTKSGGLRYYVFALTIPRTSGTSTAETGSKLSPTPGHLRCPTAHAGIPARWWASLFGLAFACALAFLPSLVAVLRDSKRTKLCRSDSTRRED